MVNLVTILKQNGKSLNDHLEKGPNYVNSLPNVLMAWRFDNVA